VGGCDAEGVLPVVGEVERVSFQDEQTEMEIVRPDVLPITLILIWR